MQQEKQFLQDLRKHFRLNIYEVKIWTALLSRGIASAGELADISGGCAARYNPREGQDGNTAGS
ncbi:hypothetical protein HYY71_00670 [Candidatus Woesearchaeota archaeon]|nr:hypothetical protein [Candidatus Woesearchaeota archaeon]